MGTRTRIMIAAELAAEGLSIGTETPHMFCKLPNFVVPR